MRLPILLFCVLSLLPWPAQGLVSAENIPETSQTDTSPSLAELHSAKSDSKAKESKSSTGETSQAEGEGQAAIAKQAKDARDPEELPPPATGELLKPDQDDLPLSPFVDTRLSFTLSDDNFLAESGETRPSSPGIDFSSRHADRVFFDNLDSRDTGFETMSHLVLYRHLPGFHRGFDSEVALVLRMNTWANEDNGKLGQSQYDDGSYIKAAWYPGGEIDADKLHFSLTLFPFNSDRFRLGYLYDISWGDSGIFPVNGIASPGAKFQMDLAPFYLYGGAKSARLLDENVYEMESNLGFLGGLGIDLFEVFTLEASGGYFDRGTNPLSGVKGVALSGYGASARGVLHLGTEVQRSLDFRLYKNDPATTDMFLLNSSDATRHPSFYLAGEYTVLTQNLQSGDTGQMKKTIDQYAHAASLSAKLRLSYFDLGADFIYRDLAFILFSRPSFVPFQAFPSSAVLEPEYMLAGSAAVVAPPLRTTFALVAGVQLPATYTDQLPGALRSEEPLGNDSDNLVIVVRNRSSMDILPCKKYDHPEAADRQCVVTYQRVPIYALRGVIKYDFSASLSFSAEATALIDANQTDIVDDEQGQVSRIYVTTAELGFPLRLGAGLFAQARF